MKHKIHAKTLWPWLNKLRQTVRKSTFYPLDCVCTTGSEGIREKVQIAWCLNTCLNTCLLPVEQTEEGLCLEKVFIIKGQTLLTKLIKMSVILPADGSSVFVFLHQWLVLKHLYAWFQQSLLEGSSQMTVIRCWGHVCPWKHVTHIKRLGVPQLSNIKVVCQCLASKLWKYLWFFTKNKNWRNKVHKTICLTDKINAAMTVISVANTRL